MEPVKGCCLLVLIGLCALFATGCERVASDGFDPASATYSPTSPRPVETVGNLTEPIVYTIDARSENVWVYFDFSRGAVVPVLDPKEDAWDLAFKRYVMKTNAAVSKVPGDVEFQADVRPKNRLYSFNPVLVKWYNYSYLANVLAPKPEVYVIRTQEGKYAKMRMLSYYCTGNMAGCMTFEYVYQGDGSRRLADGPAA